MRIGSQRSGRRNQVDFRRNNKILIRNFHETCDLHDIIKLLLVKMLRRKYPNSPRFPIYTEYDATLPCEDYPDIWMRVERDIYVWEIQRKITKSWQDKIIKQYEEVNLIIVPLELFEGLKIEQIKEKLKDYVI